MRNDSIELEEKRLSGINDVSDYRQVHERHRIFPAVFENRQHEKVLDISAGVGVVANRIKDYYECETYCNDSSPTCIDLLKKNGHHTYSFDLDDPSSAYPIPDKSFDAVISLATIEHLIHTDHFLSEVYRILKDDGSFYLSAPNYSGLTYLLPFIISGKTFHDPLNPKDAYEFFAHVRYFTYKSLVEYADSRGFVAESVYLALPEKSSKYLMLKERSPFKAFTARQLMKVLYKGFNPRWAAEPVICLRKRYAFPSIKVRKVVL